MRGREEIQPRLRRTKQGGTKTKTIRVVCKVCNSGWMSRLEKEAKPILISLVTRGQLVLDQQAQNTLAKWIALKFMVAEHTFQNDHITLESDRRKFAFDGKIPEYLRIRIGSHNTSNWSRSYLRHSATISTTLEPPENPTGRNTQSMAFGAGRLFVLAYGSRAVDPDKLLVFLRDHNFPMIQPYRGQLDWPLEELQGEELSLIATLLEKLVSKAPWKPLP